jgi:predicted transcriptional regulator
MSSNIQFSSDFLPALIKGGYKEWEENRLTQVFIAHFNAYPKFREAYCDFLSKYGLKTTNSNKLRSFSQKSYTILGGRRTVLDIQINDGNNRPVVIIENKIDAPLTSGQIVKINKALTKKSLKEVKYKIAMVKHHVDFKSKDWSTLHWQDFHEHLVYFLKKGRWSVSEKAALSAFVNLLGNSQEGFGMERIHTVAREEIKEAAIVIKELVSRENFKSNYKGGKSHYIKLTRSFEGIVKLIKLFEQVQDDIKADKDMVKQIHGKGLRAAIRLSHCNCDDSPNRVALYIWFQRSGKKGDLCAQICFTEKNHIESCVTIEKNNDWEKWQSKEFKSGINYSEFSKFIIRFWKKWLKKGY